MEGDLKLQSYKLNISEIDINEFVKWSGDANPLYVKEEFAKTTFFGKKVVHGIFSLIKAYATFNSPSDKIVQSIQVEFRGPVYPGNDYTIDLQTDKLEHILTIKNDSSSLLNSVIDFQACDIDNEPVSKDDDHEFDFGKVKKRYEAADRAIEVFEPGFEIKGIYDTAKIPGSYLENRSISSNSIKILGLCSYLVGMEIPGLRSLFMKLNLKFNKPEGQADCSKMVYHLKIDTFNPKFRILYTNLTVTNQNGVILASGQLGSYVRFCPTQIDFQAISYLLSPVGDRLKGKVAFVCGASRGLGAEIASSLALSGCHVYGGYRHDTTSARLLAEKLEPYNSTIHFEKGDAANPDWCKSVLNKIIKHHGRIDILILNACARPDYVLVNSETASVYEQYISSNIKLVQTPLHIFAKEINRVCGTIVALSSSFVEEVPKGFGHYVALKQAVEGTIVSFSKELPDVLYCIPRPPRLMSSWNDTPAGIIGALPSDQVAAGIVCSIAHRSTESKIEYMSDFPRFSKKGDIEPVINPDVSLNISATFTVDPLLPGLQFWVNELNLNAGVKVAQYGQVLQELLNPNSLLSSNKKGVSIILIRVRDWLRELPENSSQDIDFLDKYLEQLSGEFVQAVKTHRGQTTVESIIVFCPSNIESASDYEQTLLTNIETKIHNALTGIPGLKVVVSEKFHHLYEVDVENIQDDLRDDIAHMPYQNPYYNFLATLIMRHVHYKLSPVRKVIVLDCDNTLWTGVVGEVGAKALVFDKAQKELHSLLTRLSYNGMIICLCSKNEEFDVWDVFDSRDDFGLSRDRIVSAMVNWNRKSVNIQTLATRLNLGLDSFIFIDDNPVECAEVNAGCPDVLTIQWPKDTDQALKLVQHTWELDLNKGTKEDEKRAQLYKEEFKRKEFMDSTLSFNDFLSNLKLEVDVRDLNEEDLARSSQLTLRTNQFNFTTRRRKEGELKTVMVDDRYICRTIRVRDRFGDYGLVGFFVSYLKDFSLIVDTFLLSCRVLGRGVEHHMISELGKVASEFKATQVHIKIIPTPRNTPAINFLDSVGKEEYRNLDEKEAVEYHIPVDYISDLEFNPAGDQEEVPDETEDIKKEIKEETEEDKVRKREAQISRTISELSCVSGLTKAIEGTTGSETNQDISSIDKSKDIDKIVYNAFSQELNLPVETLKSIDRLEDLGCDSLKIVQLTVALVEHFPWIPNTLLFEHPTISDIVFNLHEFIENETGLNLDISKKQKDLIQDIAIVGVDVRCSGADSAEELWTLLSTGQSSVKSVNETRDYFFGVLNDDRPHWAGLMDDIDGFDAEFFKISPREAQLMDPQVRMFMEVSWGALEDAGMTIKGYEKNTGVYVGMMYGDYVTHGNHFADISRNPHRSWESFSAANRLSHFMEFNGPSLSVNTACSSSGTALHLACEAIRNKECRAAVIGGVNLILNPNRFSQLGKLGILTPSGKCRPFCADADGVVLGEGVGAVVIKPLADAKKDGNFIYGVIKGSALSTGTGTVGFTAPNPTAQAMAIGQTISNAGIDPRTISYVETHGTGTALGDPIEIRGLSLAFEDQSSWDPQLIRKGACSIGSIKPNIGHLEAGAFILGLIKVLLQFNHKQLAPSITSEQFNPQIPFDKIPFKVQEKLERWEKPRAIINGKESALPRRAGISSFGVGGANAHLIVEEAPKQDTKNKDISSDIPQVPSHDLMMISARNSDSLSTQVSQILKLIKSDQDFLYQDICHTYGIKRTGFKHRLAFSANNQDKFIQVLENYISGDLNHNTYVNTLENTAQKPKVTFLFTGQGSQYIGMGQSLYECQPVFKKAFDQCDELLQPLINRSIIDVVLNRNDTDETEPLYQTGFTQPALFAIEYSLFKLWLSWGIVPDFVSGHSAGEIVALTASGILSLEDGLKLIVSRANMMQKLPVGGKMYSVRSGEAILKEIILPYLDKVSIAAINGPDHTVISGDGKTIDLIIEKLEKQDIKSTQLKVSHAFHSPLIDPMLKGYIEIANTMTLSSPEIPLISCVDGKLLNIEKMPLNYWGRQARNSVRFLDAITTLDKQDNSIYIEIGPHPILMGMGSLCVQNKEPVWLPSLRRNSDDLKTILDSVAKLYVHGIQVDIKKLLPGVRRNIIQIPRYPFRHNKFWIPSQSIPLFPIPAIKEDVESDELDHKYYTVSWEKESLNSFPTEKGFKGSWLLFSDQEGTGSKLSELIELNGGTSILVTKGKEYIRNENDHYIINPKNSTDFKSLFQDIKSNSIELNGMVYLWGLDTPSNNELDITKLTYSTREALEGLIFLIQMVKELDIQVLNSLKVITRGAVTINNESINGPASIAQSPLWGLGRVAAIEHSEIIGGLINLAGDIESADETHLIASELLLDTTEDQVVLTKENRYVPRLLPMESFKNQPIEMDSKGVYLVTGGLGALGRRVAQWLISKGANHIILTSRQGQKAKNVDMILKELSNTKVTIDILACDISKEKDVSKLFDFIESQNQKLCGLFHIAGIDNRMPIKKMNSNDLNAVLLPKVEGGWLLHNKTKNLKLDHFICFSSIASIIGSEGRAHYAAANMFLDELVHLRKSKGLAATAINWGPWKDGGMASDEDLAQYEHIGNLGLLPEDALNSLDKVISSADSIQVMVANIIWSKFKPALEIRRKRPMLLKLGLQGIKTKQLSEKYIPIWVEQLHSSGPTEHSKVLSTLLKQEVLDLLGFEKIDEIPSDQDFTDMGMDSLRAIEFATNIQKRLGIEETIIIYDYPNILSLVPKLLKSLHLVEKKSIPHEDVASQGILLSYTPDIENKIIEFYQNAFQHRDHKLIESRWKWMFLKSAARLDIDPVMWIYNESNSVIGFTGAIPVQFQIGKEIKITYWLVDTMVLKSCRRLGLGPKIMIEAVKDVPFSLSLGQTKEMRSILYQLGWEKVSSFNSYVYPLQPHMILKDKLSPVLTKPVGTGLSIRQFAKRFLTKGKFEAFDIKEIQSYDVQHDELWNKVKNDYQCASTRDSSYMNWKYIDQPGQNFINLEIISDGKIIAIVVLTIKEPSSASSYLYRRAIIVDLVISPLNTNLLFSVWESIRKKCIALEADSIVFELINRKIEDSLLTYGFLRREPTRFLLVHPKKISEAEKGKIIVSDNWFVTTGDSDIDRP